MLRTIHHWALLGYRRLPTRVRRWIVRGIAPTYSVGAICLVERADGRVLLVRQVYRDGWGLPGGLLRRREDPGDGARREVMEEVGLAIDLVGAPAVVVAPGPQRIDVIYRARPTDPVAAEGARSRTAEITDVGWFDPESLPDLQHETAEALMALARSSRTPQAPVLGGATSLVDRLLPDESRRDRAG